MIGILGHNGAGKTTLLSILTGLLKQQRGEVCFDGKKLTPRQRRALSYLVMQDTDYLIEQLSSSGVIVFVVSHDFEFIVRTCTEVVQLDDDGAIQNQRLSPEILKTLSEKYFN